MDLSEKARVAELYERLGSARAVSKETGIPRTTIRRWIKDGKLETPSGEEPEVVFDGKIHADKPVPPKLPKRGKISYFLLTSAQNNTHVLEPFTRNIEAFRDYLSGLPDTDSVEVLVSRFTYNMNKFGKKSVKPGKHPTREDLSDLWFDDWVEANADDSFREIAPSLLWCGHMNIMPTAVRPLSGLDTYGGRKSTIFPHVKLALQSVPTMREHAAKLQYTTGSCTQRNYLQKKAGIKAEFHHAYAMLIVEVDSDGNWFVRQINADDDGSFYDLTRYVSGGKVKTDQPVLAINWGDIHLEIADQEALETAFGDNGMLDQLRPRYQFMHDLLDFRARNHHDRSNPHLIFEKYIEGTDNVEQEFINVNLWLRESGMREWCETVVVDSNHDRAFERWLREADYRTDPENAIFFLKWQLFKYESIADRKEAHLFERAVKSYGEIDEVKFLDPDESLILADIEFGMHGHLGPNGQRGAAQNLHRIGRRANVGHSHSACIMDGLYQSGAMVLNPGYAQGPSSWTYSHIVTYDNGKRTIITFWNGKWRA